MKYLVKMLDWFLSTNKTFLLVARNNEGIIIGYCGGMIKDGTLKTGSSSGMLQHSFNEAVIAMLARPWLLLHPEVLSKYKFVWGNIKRKLGFVHDNSKKNNSTNNVLLKKDVGLVGIGVMPQYFGKGVAAVLLSAFEEEAKKAGIPDLYLTVHADNLRAVKAYEKNGWAISRCENNTAYIETSYYILNT